MVGSTEYRYLVAPSRAWTMEHAELTQQIIGRAMTVHNVLGPGFLESVYKNALAHELRKAGIPFVREKRVRVYYDGIVMGEYSADLLVDSRVMVEVKAIRTLASGNEAQLVNYLTAVNIDVGLLINFGARRLEFKRKTRILQTA
jgi:GxxExxY protein